MDRGPGLFDVMGHNGGMAGDTHEAPRGGTALQEAPADALQGSSGWVTVVWDDPVNLMSYVTYVFSQYFRYPRAKAERLMMQVHMEGRAVVSSGRREEMERDVQAMHAFGLWATMSKAE